MNQAFVEIGNWMLVFAIFFGVLFGLLQWMSHGFVLKFVRIKSSRDARCVVMIRNELGNYMRTGKLSETELIVKKRWAKENIKIIIPKHFNPFFKFLGVTWCWLDEKENTFMDPATFTAAYGYDAIRQENLLIRALTGPKKIARDTKIVIILLIVILALVAYCAWNISAIKEAVQVTAGGATI